jgi:hypothetical protein
MGLTGEERTAVIGASMDVKEALEAVFEKHNLHSMQVTFVIKEPTENHTRIASASFLHWGCPGCGGISMAYAVRNLPREMQGNFVEQFGKLLGDEPESAEVVKIVDPEPTVN